MIVDDDQERARKLIDRIVRSTGLSPSEIAKKAMLSPSTITRIYPVPSVKYTLSARSLSKLESAFPIAAPVGIGSEPVTTEGHGLAQAQHSRQTLVAKTESEDRIRMYQLLPSFELDQNETGLHIDLYSGDLAIAVARLKCPIYLSDTERYFAVFMPGDSMEPRIRAGEVLLVDRLRPAALHADVLIEIICGDRSMFAIVELINRTSDQIVVKELRSTSPAAIPRPRVRNIFLIAGRFDNAIADQADISA